MTATDVAADVTAPGPMTPRPYRVVARRQDTHDTATLDLIPLYGEQAHWRSGQFMMLYAFGVGEIAVSISGGALPGEPLRHTIRDVGAVSHALTQTKVGDVIGVRGPFGTSWDAMDAVGGDLMFIAGGIGLAPLRPSILEAVRRRGEFRRVILLYGSRPGEGFLFTDEIEEWERLHGFTVHQGVRAGLADVVNDPSFDPAMLLTLACGPDIMMEVAAKTLTDRAVPPQKVRLSLERSMHCGIGLCGHCQLREAFMCVDGPVFSYDQLVPLLATEEL
ncbi:FAD/NAD(P)-binding protein [Actinotalea sp. M2MS4P-6]|uniref:FAD/NAD(P)-binding protein n=1 Tax=Actinotalea sp. M2MS4P-6 TaxID=2983762 RepID=UPI0021E4C98A|nr:FAD/NAD(P)-binding protein [Actinotalea sp. M2MS4P-6]MCV2395878.1 FAD/NAD(P)-binding protein [Actinotalea sp. M2MS4P-6]